MLMSESAEIKSHSICCSSRMFILFVGLFAFINVYALRVNMSVAMVCMTDQYVYIKQQSDTKKEKSTSSLFSSTKQANCQLNKQNHTELKRGEFHWSKQTQGYILGSFFWGYIITQIPGGWLSYRFGGKRVFLGAMAACSLATLLMPTAARLHFIFLIILRIVAGFCQGVFFSSMHAIWARWAPPNERSTLIGITFSGSQLGSVITLPVSGLLCEYGFDGGWPSIFYVFGSLGIVCCIAWLFFVFDSPRNHPRISKEEREYLENELQGQLNFQKGKESAAVPWKSIVTSLPLWAILVAHTCTNWGVYTFLTNSPTYLAEVFNLDIKSNGLFSASAYLGFWIFQIAGSLITDALVKTRLGITGARKLSNSIGLFLPALFVLLLTGVDCSRPSLAIIYFILSISFCGFQSSGFLINHADIAPKYASLLFGITNTFATIPGFVSPPLTGYLTRNKINSEWNMVFYIIATVYIFGGVFYLFFASGTIQLWAKVNCQEAKNEDDDDDDNHLGVY